MASICEPVRPCIAAVALELPAPELEPWRKPTRAASRWDCKADRPAAVGRTDPGMRVRRVSLFVRQRASVGSTEVSNGRLAVVGRIDRSIGEPPCARRCRRTDARKRSLGRPGHAERGQRSSVLPIAGFDPCLGPASGPDLNRAWPGRRPRPPHHNRHEESCRLGSGRTRVDDWTSGWNGSGRQ